jgi:AraC-like DNA-binding protein/thioredoxin-related protein
MVVKQSSADFRVQAAIDVLFRGIDQELSIEILAEHVNLSASRLRQLIKASTGLTFTQLKNQVRLFKAKSLLETTFLSVKEVQAAVGYADRSHSLVILRYSSGCHPAIIDPITRVAILPQHSHFGHVIGVELLDHTALCFRNRPDMEVKLLRDCSMTQDKYFRLWRPLGYLLLVLALGLCTLNFVLVRKNAQLSAELTLRAHSMETPTGIRAPLIKGVDLKGDLISVNAGQDKRKMLILVFSPTCHFCERSWPKWAELLRGVDQSSLRVVGVNLASDLPASYVQEHGLTRMETVAKIDPQSVLLWNFRTTPETVLVNQEGRVEKVWGGLVDDVRLREIASAASVPLPSS